MALALGFNVEFYNGTYDIYLELDLIIQKYLSLLLNRIVLFYFRVLIKIDELHCCFLDQNYLNILISTIILSA